MKQDNNWSKQELEACVMVYLEMIHKQENEEPLVKRAYFNSLSESGEWQKFIKSKKFEVFNGKIPISPAYAYKDSGWKGYPDFLGYQIKKKKYIPYNEAKKYIQKYGFLNKKQYDEYFLEGVFEKNLPKYPHEYYKKNKSNDWEGWPIF